jgi:hypothetical protein
MEDFFNIGVLIVIAFVLISFLLLREVVLWYYKINKSIDLQIEANNHLKKISEQNEQILNYYKKKEADSIYKDIDK